MKQILKFEKEGCVPCRMVDSLLDSKGVATKKFDVLSDSDSVEKYEIQSVPVIVLIDENENEIKRSIGFNPPELEEIISLLNN